MASNNRQKLKRVKEKDIPQFQCQICSKILSDKTSYKIHIQLHSDERPWACDLCSYRGKLKKYVSRHKMKVHSQAKGPQCPVCLKVFHFTTNLQKHMRVHTGEKPHQCQVCGKAFSSTYCLRIHKRIHTNEKPYHCTFCDYACRDSSTLRKHQDRHLGIKPKTYNCVKCKKRFNKNELLRIHVDEIHKGLNTRKLPCEICNKMFKTRGVLKTHIKLVHEKSTKTVCDICDKVLSKYNMSNHLLTHVDIRPFKCNFKGCGKKFKDQSALKKHTLIHYPKFQFKCDLCDARFTRKHRFRAHKAKHLVENGFECNYCGITIHSKKELLSHITKKHKNIKKFICDVCKLVTYSKKSIILHLKYGHGNLYGKTCKICSEEMENSKSLKKHYLKLHNVKYIIQRSPGDIEIKEEPLELNTEFDYDYEDVQKIEIDADRTPDLEYADVSTTLAYSKSVLEEDISMIDTTDQPNNEFDEFIQKIVRKNSRKAQHDIDTSLEYSKNVPEEDTVEYRQHNSAFNKFFKQQVLKNPEKKKEKSNIKKSSKERKKAKVDVVKLKRMKKTIHKMLKDSEVRREIAVLENMRRNYNIRIEKAHYNNKKVPTKIKYYKTSLNKKNEENSEETENDETIPDSENVEQNDLTNNDKNKANLSSTEKEKALNNNKNLTNKENAKSDEIVQNNSERNEKHNNNTYIDKETLIETTENLPNPDLLPNLNENYINNKKISQNSTENENTSLFNENNCSESVNNGINYENTNSRKTRSSRNRKIVENNKNENYSNGKLKFLGHQCYICFKVFKTKEDLKAHCYEHFNICNEQMLKKCPFCGYVTNRHIKNHIELIHNINMNYAYGQVTKKNDKYLFEIDDDCQLEVIPSISNLNRLAGMRIDEKNRQSKNIFLGKTKLVKKGKEWVVEKQAVKVNNEYILPEFSEKEYLEIKIEGDSYFDKLKKLGFLAKNRGGKMLYPCNGCEKLCQSLCALKLHNRKHEENPKKFKPKNWVNRHIEYTTAKKKSVRCSNKTIKRKKKLREEKKAQKKPEPVKFIPVRKPVNTENRYAAPQPVKNKHKCDKKLIEFYKSNIKGGDIEFWQFLKIFNKMNRENVNDFEDLVNRDDVHFGIHVNDKTGNKNKTGISENIVTETDFVANESVACNGNDKIPVLKTGIAKKSKKSKYTRTVMLSRKEYKKRNEIINELRRRLAENKKKASTS